MALQKKPAYKKGDSAGSPLALWRRDGVEYLLSNDAGEHIRLNESRFRRVISGQIAEKDPSFSELMARGFIRNRMNFEDFAAKWRSRNAYLNYGPGLHILVLTLRCNHKCLYCQSAAVGVGEKNTDMSLDTARKCVDFAFNSPNPGITLEFQGGEPLLNWDVLKAAVKHARKKGAASGKEVTIALVSNFSLMTEEKACFLLENEVSICTSLDGPRALHNKNRVRCGDSYGDTVKWIRYFQKTHKKQVPAYRVFKPSALLTVSRYSLPLYKEVVDEYLSLGLEDVFLRPLASIGYAKQLWGTIGYTAAEYVDFYTKSLDYILRLNRAGKVIREKTASMMLEKIINSRDPGYLDSRCPCGAAIGQLAYNYNGDIFTCDEGRMVGWSGDDLFRIGSVFADSYRGVMGNPAAKICVLSSNLESQPVCVRCAYKPYCGVCPVYNYETQGTVWGDMPSNDRCRFFKGIFGAIFERLKDSADAEIFKKWVAK